MSKVFVHLGRYGDIVNTLPLLKLHAEAQGAPVRQVVCWQYASVLEGVSYVQPMLYPNEFADLMPAIAMAKQLDRDAVNLQVSGTGWVQPRLMPSFLQEQWSNAGKAMLWDTMPVVFDRRDLGREQRLADRTLSGPLPVVLVATHGFSSPFAHGADLLAALRERLKGRAWVVDMAGVKAERIYDLLGLMDRAACLVTIDTMHMHLARASAVPVVALANDTNSPWHQSARRHGQVWYGTYTQYAIRKDELLQAVEQCLPSATHQPAPLPAAAPAPRIIHVHPVHALHGDAQRRHATAAASWARSTPNWQRVPAESSLLPRTARDLGDARDLPFVQDLLRMAMEQAASDDDVLVLSNGDACLTDGIEEALLRVVRERGACYTHRWDFPHAVEMIRTPSQVAMGRWYPGSDLFAFTARWWRAHGPEYPDMLLGVEYVDAVLRQLIKKHCGTDAEAHRCVYHEEHASAWKSGPSPAGRHNALLARLWFAQHGCDDLDPFGAAQAERLRVKRGTPNYLRA